MPIPYTNLRMINRLIEGAAADNMPNKSCRMAFHLINTDLPTLSEKDCIYEPILTPRYTMDMSIDLSKAEAAHSLSNSGKSRPRATLSHPSVKRSMFKGRVSTSCALP